MPQTASRIGPAIGLAAHLGHGLQRVATDLTVGRARALPRTVGDLDAEYLSKIMSATVTSVSVIGGDGDVVAGQARLDRRRGA